MIVKIRDTYYSAHEEPIMLLLEDDDIKNLAAMPEGNRVFCVYPDSMDPKEVKAWMELTKPEKIVKPQSNIIVPKLAPRRGFKR